MSLPHYLTGFHHQRPIATPSPPKQMEKGTPDIFIAQSFALFFDTIISNVGGQVHCAEITHHSTPYNPGRSCYRLTDVPFFLHPELLRAPIILQNLTLQSEQGGPVFYPSAEPQGSLRMPSLHAGSSLESEALGNLYDIIFWGQNVLRNIVGTLSVRFLTSVWKVFLSDLLHGVVSAIRVFNTTICTAHAIISPIIIRARS